MFQVPPNREVLCVLPNVFSALCLNNRGRRAFMERKPFDRLFHVFLSPEYVPAMQKKQRNGDHMGNGAFLKCRNAELCFFGKNLSFESDL